MLPSAPSHAFPFNIPLLRLHERKKLGREIQRLCVTHIQSADWSGFTAMVSDVSLQFSRVLEKKNWIPYPPALLTPAEPKKHHRGDRESERWRKRKCGGTLKRWWSRIGGEVNGEDKEVVGGCEGKKGDWRKHDKEGKKSSLALFKLGDSQSLLLTPTCISGSLETFKLHL